MYKVFLRIITVVILLLALNPHRLLAATKYVPTQEQLQPMPANVQPNLSGNVNYIDPSGEDQTAEESNGNTGNQNAESITIKPKAPRPSLIANIISLPVQNNTAGKIAWWLIVFGLAGAGTWLIKKRYDKK